MRKYAAIILLTCLGCSESPENRKDAIIDSLETRCALLESQVGYFPPQTTGIENVKQYTDTDNSVNSKNSTMRDYIEKVRPKAWKRYAFVVITFKRDRYEPNPDYITGGTEYELPNGKTIRMKQKQFIHKGIDTLYYISDLKQIDKWTEDDEYRFLDEVESSFEGDRSSIIHRKAYCYDSYAEASKHLETFIRR